MERPYIRRCCIHLVILVQRSAASEHFFVNRPTAYYHGSEEMGLVQPFVLLLKWFGFFENKEEVPKLNELFGTLIMWYLSSAQRLDAEKWTAEQQGPLRFTVT